MVGYSIILTFHLIVLEKLKYSTVLTKIALSISYENMQNLKVQRSLCLVSVFYINRCGMFDTLNVLFWYFKKVIFAKNGADRFLYRAL